MARALRKKARPVFRCQACGHAAPKWSGRCSECGEWNSIVEEAAESRQSERALTTSGTAPVPVTQIEESEHRERQATGMSEVDRVLGGGLVPGSLVLLGGDPGVGKSTLLCQIMAGISSGERPVLYASGEESVAQAGMRARRVGADNAGLLLIAETRLEAILKHAEAEPHAVVAIDSIQTMHTDAVDSIPGSVSQVRECTARLLRFAKQTGTPTILVGHVTKDGSIAGPRTLEHMVDTVLHFEGEGENPYRILRGVKNRFGSTQEIGVFEMRSEGLREVDNPSALFLSERPEGAPGSTVVASLEGTRPILVEVQALVAPPAGNIARRTCAGVDGNRVALLLAVLARRAGLDILSDDVFVNVAGGVRLTEPAADLGVACALASSAYDQVVDPGTVVFGEVGLAGEVRAVSQAELRIAEASKLGFTRCILPEQNKKRLEGQPGLEVHGVRHLKEALKLLG
jgi:DNA repair protein RadA/Sms